LKKPGKTGGLRPTAMPRRPLGAAAVLLAGLFMTGCVSVAPPDPGVLPEADPDQAFIQTFISKYQDFHGAEESGLSSLAVFGGEEPIILPGCLLPCIPAGIEGEADRPGGALPEAREAREVRGPLIYLSGGTLEDYEGRNAAGRIVILEPVVEELTLALHQARLFGASAVVAAPRAGEGAMDSSLTLSPAGARDPGIPVFLVFPSGMLQLRAREGTNVILRFPGEPRGDGAPIFGETGYLQGRPEGPAGEGGNGLFFLPEQRREGERRLRALQAALAEHERTLRRPRGDIAGLLDSSPEEWVRDILLRDRQPLPLLPWDPRLREAWTRGVGEAKDPEFYHTVMDRVEEWNRRASGIPRADPESPGRKVAEKPDSRRFEAETALLSRDLRKFWSLLELDLLNRTLREGVILLETGREELLPGLFSPYLVSAWAVPRYHPEAAAAVERGRSTASPGEGGRWLPELGDLFLSLHLGLQDEGATRAGMIKELKYWENRSREVLREGEDQFLSGVDDLLFRMDRLEEELSQEPETEISSLPIP
jgi:hypothetical protein